MGEQTWSKPSYLFSPPNQLPRLFKSGDEMLLESETGSGLVDDQVWSRCITIGQVLERQHCHDDGIQAWIVS